MLDELHVSDIALIEDACIGFAPGLTVLTGETGAGKTALLSALQLICGQRADSKAVRDGSEEATAEARFVNGDEEHIVRRRLSSKGRSRCTVDGSMATVAEVARASASIRIHSQHEQVQLLQPAAQLGYLDAWISPEAQHLAPYHAARAAYLAAREKCETLEKAQAAALQELEFMRFTANQIEAIAPRAGEYEELEGELGRLQHGEQLADAVACASAALSEDGAALDLIAEATAALDRQAGIDSDLDELGSRLAGLQAELEDLGRDLRAYGETVSYDPYRLAAVLERLDALSGLMKRFGPGMEQVLEAWNRAQRAIDNAQASPEQIEQARCELAKAEAAYRDAAEELSVRRHEAAERFCAQLADSVHELAMEGAVFKFDFQALDFERWSASGSERIELLYCPSAAVPARPLARIASGGELSRILLSIECLHHAVATADAIDETLVFDEVDQGIGGATGAAVAHRLAQLSRRAQLIVVTHLPQVAALADKQYVVTKTETAGGLPSTSVVEVAGEERVAEIARMLAGSADETALDHARSLLAGSEVV